MKSILLPSIIFILLSCSNDDKPKETEHPLSPGYHKASVNRHFVTDTTQSLTMGTMGYKRLTNGSDIDSGPSFDANPSLLTYMNEGAVGVYKFSFEGNEYLIVVGHTGVAIIKHK